MQGAILKPSFPPREITETVERITDPLITAIIAKLPAAGDEWPAQRRAAWLAVMQAALNLVYGPTREPAIRTATPRSRPAPAKKGKAVSTAKPKPAPKAKATEPGPRLGKKRAPDQKFVICLDGMAWGPDNKLILPTALGNGDILWDFRPGEPPLETIVWADGETRAPHDLPALQVLKG